MHAQREVGVAGLERLERRVGAQGAREVAFDPPNRIVLGADAVEREVDDDLGLGAGLHDLLDAAGNDLILDAVGRDVDDARPAVAVGARDHLGQVLAQCGLPAAEGEPVGRAAQRLEGAVPLLQGEVVVGQQPDVAGLAARVAAIARADGDVQRQGEGAPAHVGGVQHRNLGEDLAHAHDSLSLWSLTRPPARRGPAPGSGKRRRCRRRA